MKPQDAIKTLRLIREVYFSGSDEVKEAIDMVTELAEMQVEEWALEQHNPNTTREKPEHIRKPL